jgi:hypothetical protein
MERGGYVLQQLHSSLSYNDFCKRLTFKVRIAQLQIRHWLTHLSVGQEPNRPFTNLTAAEIFHIIEIWHTHYVLRIACFIRKMEVYLFKIVNSNFHCKFIYIRTKLTLE